MAAAARSVFFLSSPTLSLSPSLLQQTRRTSGLTQRHLSPTLAILGAALDMVLLGEKKKKKLLLLGSEEVRKSLSESASKESLSSKKPKKKRRRKQSLSHKFSTEENKMV